MPEFKDISQEITKAVRDAAYVVVGSASSASRRPRSGARSW